MLSSGAPDEVADGIGVPDDVADTVGIPGDAGMPDGVTAGTAEGVSIPDGVGAAVGGCSWPQAPCIGLSMATKPRPTAIRPARIVRGRDGFLTVNTYDSPDYGDNDGWLRTRTVRYAVRGTRYAVRGPVA
ncbi:hypothetical protein GCM10023194_24240 [Planotetraspora phitsanulokensis]|uniref:Uncharacterized protein n=1 Tax=Planotetraspora phitsanulokensis TaxID=575192 RepID=A0A8J3XFU2_9ACTN|nr:hypothetical protein Pph01_34840 [Planotetraspora phitsanulokensis]